MSKYAITLLLAAAPLSAQAPKTVAFEDVFEWMRSVELAQTEQVLSVSPRIRSDPRGGWLVIDPPEHQVRLYDRDGRLKGHFGREGDGPGEFRTLIAAVRTHSGSIVAVDAGGRFTALSADLSAILYDFTLPLNVITDAQLIGRDSLLVITAPRVRGTGIAEPVLHVVDVTAKKLLRSFHSPNIPRTEILAWVTVLGGRIGISGDRIGVTLPLLDSLVLFLRIGDAPVVR